MSRAAAGASGERPDGGARQGALWRAGRPFPAFGRVAAALDAAGVTPIPDARLGALVLCTAATLGPVDADGALALRPLAIAHRLGADVADVRRSIAALADAGVVEGDVDGAPDAAEVAVTVAWELVGAPGVVAAVDWRAVVERLAGQAAAIGVALAFAESTVAPGEPTPMTIPQLVARARWSDRTVKSALTRLIDAGVLVRGGKLGPRARYAFSDAALGLAPFAAPGDETEPPAGATAAAALSPAPPPAAAPAMAPGPAASGVVTPALFLEINGVPVPLPRGAMPQLEQDAAGRYWYRVGALRLGPVAL